MENNNETIFLSALRAFGVLLVGLVSFWPITIIMVVVLVGLTLFFTTIFSPGWLVLLSTIAAFYALCLLTAAIGKYVSPCFRRFFKWRPDDF